MQVLCVSYWESDGRCYREIFENMPIVAVRAKRTEGGGDAALQYEGRTEMGRWFTFRKKDNPKAKLPKSKQFTSWSRQLVDVRGVRGVYHLISNEIEI